MTVTRVNSGNGSTASATSQAITMSGSPTAGNLLLGAFYTGNTDTSNTVAAPTGWTKFWSNGGLTSTAPTSPLMICYRIVVAGDGTSWTFTTTGTATFLAAYAGEYSNSAGPWVAVIDDQHGDATAGTGTSVTVTATAPNTQANDFGFVGVGQTGTVTSWSWGAGGFVDGGVNVGSRLAVATKDMSAIETSTATPNGTGGSSFLRTSLGTFKQPTPGAAPRFQRASFTPIIRAANF